MTKRSAAERIDCFLRMMQDRRRALEKLLPYGLAKPGPRFPRALIDRAAEHEAVLRRACACNIGQIPTWLHHPEVMGHQWHGYARWLDDVDYWERAVEMGAPGLEPDPFLSPERSLEELLRALDRVRSKVAVLDGGAGGGEGGIPTVGGNFRRCGGREDAKRFQRLFDAKKSLLDQLLIVVRHLSNLPSLIRGWWR